ncbi:MAG: methyltransferase [Polyangiaceae bacterium]
MAKRASGFDLAAKIADSGFTPGARDVPALLDLLASAPEEVRDHAERALRRVGAPAVGPAMERARDATPAARGRFVALAGRIAGAAPSPELTAFFVDALHDGDAGVRRRAAASLGRAFSPAAATEEALASAARQEKDAAARAAMVDALGKLGGDAARAVLGEIEQAHAGDTKTASALRKARVRAARPAAREEAAREEAAGVDVGRALDAGVTVWLDTRRGMLPVLQREAAGLHPHMAHRLDGTAVVAVDLRAPLSALFDVRTWIGATIPGGDERVAAHGPPNALVTAVAKAIVFGRGRAAVAALTRGPVRYRIAFAGGGKRRATVFAIAEAVTALDPTLVNDPKAATWQIDVRERADRVSVEWAPSLEDPRFAYRSGDVPAASHPAIAAALAYLAGTRSDEVCWDPFVGSGLELCERSKRGPYARLVGTDLDPAALEIARKNLTAAGADRFELLVHDAERGAPRGVRPTLVITNPPMGRRVHRSADLRTFLASFVTATARSLAPRGRLVWVSPFAADTRAAALGAGLRFERGHVVDMGGFDAELQVWTKSS